MSFFDDASLVFLPSGEAGKDGKAYSMKPTNGNGDFTFSRGSNLTATRVDSNGLIEKGRENLLLQSNQFDTTWGNVNTTETSGQSGYDGTNDAWLLSITASGGYLYQDKAVSGVQTFSFYAKEGTLARVNVVINASVNVTANFDLANGIVLGGSQNITSSISSIGNGWYRCSVTYDKGTTNRFRLYPVELAGGGTSGNIYIQDAQLEIGLTSTEYIESGASTGKAGLLEDSPRFDYSGGASCPSLLLEPSRTNEIGYSEYFDSWIKVGSPTITNNYGISPEGVQNSTRFQTISDRITNSVSTINANETFSIYMKGSGTLLIQIGSDNFRPSVTSEWVRYEFTTTQVGGNSNVQIRGNNSAVDVELYGAQYERNSYPTSYIPNHSGGSVTRNADSCSGAGTSSTFNANEGVFYAEISTNTDGTDKAISLNNGVAGSLNNRLWMGYSTSNKRIYALGYVNNSFQFALNKLMTDESLFVKIACRYKRDDIAFFVNGEKVGTDTSALNFTELNSLDFNIGTGISGASPLYGNVKQVLVFNSYLSDAECITLTS